jgi:anti-anti-sigma regulatory factor
MGQEPPSLPGGLAVRRESTDGRVVVTLAGRLELDDVEQVAACADEIFRSKARSVVFDVSGVTSTDDAGVRTLAAACRCLSGNGIEAKMRGIGADFRKVLRHLSLDVPESHQPVTVPGPRAADTVVGR